ncbi:MAG: hypothetical protein ACPMAQ_13110 [Phycisphaerae bacterium]
MKRYWPIIVATAAAVLAVILVFVSVPAAEQAGDQLHRDVDRELAKARRILASYSPGEQMLLAAQERLTGKAGPLQVTDATLSKWTSEWDKITSYADQESPLKPVSSAVEQQLSEANRLLAQYAGGAAPAPAVSPASDAASAVRSTEQWLKANEGRLKEAIAVVDAALAMSVTSGETTFSGRDIPEASRLRAILAYHYAESRRRSALLDRAEIERLTTRLMEAYGRWIGVTSDLAIAEQALTGKPVTMPGTATAPGTSSAPVEPATSSAPASEAAAAAPATTGPADESKLLHKLFGAFAGRGKAAAAEEPSEAASPSAEGGEKPGRVIPAPRSGPVESLPERIARLERDSRDAAARAAAIEIQLKAMKDAHDALEAKIKAKRAEAAEADREMVELENRGFDPSHPEVLKKRTAAYEAASKRSREASREADLLEYGGYPNATLISEHEDWHAARIAPANAGELLRPQKSLRQCKQEISSTEAALRGERDLAALIANRLDGLRRMKADFESRITGGRGVSTQPTGSQPSVRGLRDQRDALAAEIRNLMTRIQDLASQADAHEEAAIAETDRGIAAAKQARAAIVKRQSDAKADQPPEGEPNPRLQKIEQENWRVGDADAIQADLHLLQAWIRYQRLEAKRRLADTLTAALQMGIRTNPQAERAAADEQIAPAVSAAQAAAKLYETAEPDLKKDWTLQVDQAAAYYLLSQLTQGPEAQKYRDDAIKGYQAGVAGQETNPDRLPYVARLESIQKQKKATSRPAPK